MHDPEKNPPPSGQPGKPKIPDNTVPHNVPPPRRPTDADPDPAPAFDRGDAVTPRTVRRDG